MPENKPITAFELVSQEFGFELAMVWKAWNVGHDYHRRVYFGPAIPRIVRRLRAVRAQNDFLKNLGGNVAAAFELEARGRALLESGAFLNAGGKYLPEGVTDEALRGARKHPHGYTSEPWPLEDHPCRLPDKDEHGFYR